VLDSIRRLCGLVPHVPALRFRLAELLYDLKHHEEALDLLEELLDDPEHRVGAHFLLGDYHGREANLERALRHYEAVLALDFGHPRARRRADEIRSRMDRPVATSAPTILGAEELGPGSRFLLQRELGRGGGGAVYLAQDRELQRPVAVKVLHPHVVERQEARTHLFCEARIAAALHHRGIITVYDLDESLNLVVMEYCAGGALEAQIGRQGHAQALRRMAEVLAVLDVVHRCGVVHRDLKPANLLLRTRDVGSSLVLTDFGIAHAPVEAGAEAAAAGSLLYMAPEQRRGAEGLDARADLYACGVILVEMLLGRKPLSPQEALQGALLRDLEPVWRDLTRRLPGALARPLLELCQELVSPAPDERPSEAIAVGRRCLELAGALEEQEVRQGVLRELEGMAGPPPRSDEVERWLRDQRQLLV
jgi:serine/threonine-protein kinase